jgi:MFS family permease
MWRKLLFFGLLYFIQGAALAYIINFQKPYLVESGVSKDAIGLFTSLLLIPFIAKIFLGYISDRFPLGRFGSRKPYMVIGLTIFTLAFLSLANVTPKDNFPLFAVSVWFASLGLAWFDACADGWAVDVSTKEEQSPVQASMIAGKAVGMIMMAGLFGLMAYRYGFSSIFLTIAGLAIIVLAIVLNVKHMTPVKDVEVFVHNWRDALSGYYLFFLFFGLICAVASAGNDGLITLHYAEVFKADSVDVGLFGVSRGVGALLGAGGFAFVRSRVTAFKSYASAALLLGGGCLLSSLPIPPLVSAALWGVCWGFQETSFVTMAMTFAQGKWAATIFATSMIFANLGVSVGEGIGAPLVPRIGYDGVFMVYAAFAWASLIFLCLTFHFMKKAGHSTN